MSDYPVHYGVERPERFTRLQLFIRFVAFCALGVIGLSFGTVFLFAYLALPVFAASRLSARGDPEAYVERDGPRVTSVLRWFAAVCAWAGLIAEHLPGRSPAETVMLEVHGSARPTPGSAMWRVITGIPSAFVLGFLCFIGIFVWLWAALSILFVQRVGSGAFHYLVGLQRWSLRLLAYQASLVDEYPPFSFADGAAPLLPTARAMG
jgi:hypothetical protein